MAARAPSLSSVRLSEPMDCRLTGSSVRGFPRQECWSGLPFPSPGDLRDPGIESVSPALAGGFFTTEQPRKPSYQFSLIILPVGSKSQNFNVAEHSVRVCFRLKN